jgi:hypothetical protein
MSHSFARQSVPDCLGRVRVRQLRIWEVLTMKASTRTAMEKLRELKVETRQLLGEKKLSYVDLAAAIGCTDEWVGKCLSTEETAFFAFKDVPAIAKRLGVEWGDKVTAWYSEGQWGVHETPSLPPSQGDVFKETVEDHSAAAAEDAAYQAALADGHIDTAEQAHIRDARRRADRERHEKRAAQDFLMAAVR